MKKNYVMNRLVSLAMAVMLSGGAMFTTALAAMVPVVDNTNPANGTTGVDVYYHDASAKTKDSAVSTTTVTGFIANQDYISVKLPVGLSLSKTLDGSDTQVSITDGTSPAVNLFKVIGIQPANVRDITPDQPVIFGVGETGLTSDKVKRNAAFSFAPSATRADGGAVTYEWKQDNGAIASTIIVDANGKLNVPANALTAGSHLFSLTVKDASGKTATWSKTVTVEDVCDATVSINFGSTQNNVSLVGSAGTTMQVAATASVSATNCTDDSHKVEGSTHDKNLDVTLALTPMNGVSLKNGVLSIEGTVANGAVITITASAAGVNKTHNVTVNRTAAACDFTTTGVTFAPAGKTINTESETSITFTPTVLGTGGTSCADHGGALPHGRNVTWTVSEKGVTPEDVTIPGVAKTKEGNNLKLDFTAANLVKPETIIVVKATVDGKSYQQEYTLTREKKCTLTASLTNGKVTATSPSSGSSLTTVNNVPKLTVNASSATLQMNAEVTKNGSCEWGETNTACPTFRNHGLNWSISCNPTSNAVTINSVTGLLSVDYSKLGTQEVAVTVYTTPATTRNVQQGNIVVRRGTLPSSGGNNDNDNDYSEQQKNSEQWDKLEYRIEDADSKDTLTMNMGSNTNMPTRVVRELVGQNVTVELSVTGGYTWIINGKNLKKPPVYQIGIGLGVESVKNKDATRLAKGHSIKVLELEHEGSFYGTYTLEQRVDTDYSGKYLYLYKYDEDADKLYYRGSAKVDSDGYVKFPFTSASTYVMTDKALYGEKAGSTVGGGTGSGTGSSSGGGTTVVVPPASSVAPPPASSSTVSSSSSSESSSSGETSSEIELPSSSEVSRPTDTEPDDEAEEKPEKKSIPLIVPILLVVVTITIVAVILLAKGGINIGN